MNRFVAAAGAIGIAAAAGLLGAGPVSAAAADTGTVYVVHGVPDTPVDVYVDGQKALDDFQPGDVKGPLELPAGAHKLAVTAADASDDSKPLLSASADLAAGANVSVVAHLDVSGKPALTVFADDVSRLPAGQSRLVVRHVAAAPAVDVRAGGTVVLSDVTNPHQGALTVPAGTVSADVVLAGTDTVVIGPADVRLAAGTATFVHAIGTADGGKLSLVSFTIGGLGAAPDGVPAGTGPAGRAIPIGAAVLLLLAGVVLVLTSGRRLVAARDR